MTTIPKRKGGLETKRVHTVKKMRESMSQTNRERGERRAAPSSPDTDGQTFAHTHVSNLATHTHTHFSLVNDAKQRTFETSTSVSVWRERERKGKKGKWLLAI